MRLRIEPASRSVAVSLVELIGWPCAQVATSSAGGPVSNANKSLTGMPMHLSTRIACASWSKAPGTVDALATRYPCRDLAWHTIRPSRHDWTSSSAGETFNLLAIAAISEWSVTSPEWDRH